jgi:hypothetical protein
MKKINIELIPATEAEPQKKVLTITDEGRSAVVEMLSNKNFSPLQILMQLHEDSNDTFEATENLISLCKWYNVKYEGKNMFFDHFFSKFDNAEDILNELMEKGIVVFSEGNPEHNKELTAELRRKMTVESFGTYCPQPIITVSIETQKRYEHLANINEPLMKAMSLLKARGGVIGIDKERFHDIKKIHLEVSKEMDLLIEKMNFLKIISGGNVMHEGIVNEQYRKFRGVVDTAEPEVAIQEDEPTQPAE